MPGEKRHWQWPSPFRRFSGTQDLRPKRKVGRSKSRVSSVYLSDGTSTSGFVVFPEFDYPVQTETAHEESNNLPELPSAVTPNPLGPDGVERYLCDLEPNHNSCLERRSSPPNTNWDNDLSQRLDSAYEHIRSMPSALSKISLSSDPQMLRKQLGVPQHSVLNYPIHSSPDLPNPHTFSLEPASAASSDTAQVRTSRKLNLYANANGYSTSPPHCPADSFRPIQKESVINVPTLTGNRLSQGCTPEAPCSSHIDSTQRPQLPVPITPKLAKRRVAKTTISSPPLPSFRQALRGVLRKPAIDTPSSTNVHGWQTSLPQIRSPSPFKVDIPLHHAWHDRQTKFNSPSEYHSMIGQSHERKSGQTSGRDILASLVWIGTPQTTSSPYAVNRRCPLENPAFLPDRVNMAITAVEDDSISDDVLVDRLEKVRRIGGASEPAYSRDILPLSFPNNTHFSGTRDENRLLPISCPSSSIPTFDLFPRPNDKSLPSALTTQDAISDSEDAKVWQVVRKTLLCIREIVRTEKKYQEALTMLLNAQTATPPPPSMVPYISELVRVSEMLLGSFLEDPSAWGISAAFVTSEDELEATMVSWCAVAGAFFMDENDLRSSGLKGNWRCRKSGVTSSSSSSMTKEASIFHSPRLPPLFTMISTANRMKERTEEDYGAWKYTQEKQRLSVSLALPQKPENTNGQSSAGQPPSRKPSVRDLAIQPIQRVMRYVLLYKDLLDCTPPMSPPRLLVERALEAATRIANHCDKAQRNPAFFRAS